MTSDPEACKKGTTIKNHSRAVSRQREVVALMLPTLPSTCSWEERAAHARSRVVGQAAAREPATRAGERPRRGWVGAAWAWLCPQGRVAPGRAHATCARGCSGTRRDPGCCFRLEPSFAPDQVLGAGSLSHPREQRFWIQNALLHPGQNPELPQHVQQMEQKRLVMETTLTLERTRRPCLRTKASFQRPNQGQLPRPQGRAGSAWAAQACALGGPAGRSEGGGYFSQLSRGTPLALPGSRPADHHPAH